MKMKKMIGAVALTAALAMGTAPAFAGSVTSTDSENAANAFSENGSTEIRAKVDNIDPNVRATVPLKVVVVFGATGASDILGPSSDSYKISNIGDGDIKVVDVELTDMNSAFTSDRIYDDGGTWSTTSGAITSGDYLMFTYKTAGNYTTLTTSHKGSNASTSGMSGDHNFITGAKTWTQETIASKGDLPIELAGKAYFTSTLDSGEMTDTLCNIKYTIAAA